jgi:ubiquinone/menaquinone biosynthesis C-methylase UbiE
MKRKLWRLTLKHLDGYGQLTGDALDIGTGNGSLAVISAMENTKLRVIGIDLWEPQWEYSLDDCRRNAQRAGVTERCTFQRASAHVLPYANETFDYVMSHFVFHEVKAAPDKRTVVEEALRVLRKAVTSRFTICSSTPASTETPQRCSTSCVPGVSSASNWWIQDN